MYTYSCKNISKFKKNERKYVQLNAKMYLENVSKVKMRYNKCRLMFISILVSLYYIHSVSQKG